MYYICFVFSVRFLDDFIYELLFNIQKCISETVH